MQAAAVWPMDETDTAAQVRTGLLRPPSLAQRGRGSRPVASRLLVTWRLLALASSRAASRPLARFGRCAPASSAT